MIKFNTAATMLAAAIGLTSIAAAKAANAPNAAVPTADVPSLAVKYSPAMLATDRGAREVYHRLVMASETVCPAPSSASPFVSDAIKDCRAQALSRAVRLIDDSRLAALYANGSKNG